MDKVFIGNKLRELRERRGLNAEEVAAILLDQYLINISYKTLYNYEKARSSPDTDIFLSLCKIYGCSDVLYEFGYTDIKCVHKVRDPEEKEIVEKYHDLSESGKDMIRGALGIEKSDSEQMKGIS